MASFNPNFVDYYSLLKVDLEANDEELKAAYQKQLLLWQPNKTGQTNKADMRTALISEAFKVLSDPLLRISYDHGWRERQSSTSQGSSTFQRPTSSPDIEVEQSQWSGRSKWWPYDPVVLPMSSKCFVPPPMKDLLEYDVHDLSCARAQLESSMMLLNEELMQSLETGTCAEYTIRKSINNNKAILAALNQVEEPTSEDAGSLQLYKQRFAKVLNEAYAGFSFAIMAQKYFC